MHLMFIGDVVGATGCNFLASKIPTLKKKYSPDILVVNGENSATGNGITVSSANSLLRLGADVITTGNHAFRRHESQSAFEDIPNLLRPANFPEGVLGRGFCILDLGRTQIAVVNLMGTAFMDPLDNPFSVIDKLLKEIPCKNIFLDFHAEATAEKKAMGYYLDGRITALFGTHTHVQTADETVLKGGTAYITDVGMTGPEESVLGVCKDAAISKLRFHLPVRFTEAETACFVCGCVVDFDEKTGLARSVERVCER